MSKTVIQASLIVLFAVLVICCVVVFLVSGREIPGQPAIIAILIGGVILSAVLPQLQEITIGPKGISAKLRELQDEIDVLKFLVSGYVTGFELEHLRKLAAPGSFPFHRGDTFLEELRRLWRHGLIKKVQEGWFIGQLPDSGNLKDYIAITKRGQLYLKMLKQVQAERESDGENQGGGLDA